MARTLEPVRFIVILITGCTLAQCRNTPSEQPPVSPLTPAAVSQPSPPADLRNDRPASASIKLSRAEAIEQLCHLYETRDTDCDQRITRLDELARCGQTSCETQPAVPALAHRGVQLQALHQASQLATELADSLLSSDAPDVTVELERVLADPASYLVYRIQHRYWDALTRTIDPNGEGLERALRDEKQGHGSEAVPDWCAQTVPRCRRRGTIATPLTPEPPTKPEAPGFLYVPADDPAARKLYAPASAAGDLKLGEVPRPVTANWVNQLTRTGAHGLLTLAYDKNLKPMPFVVPGGRFNEMYGWDSFFITWGLVQTPGTGALPLGGSDADYARRLTLAKAMVEHQEYEIRHYGKVLNANRTYYLTRSQPPFVAPLMRMVSFAARRHDATDANPDNEWLRRLLQATILEYEAVWAARPRRTDLCEGPVCLARYYGEGKGQPPEVEKGHFAAMYQKHAVDHGHCKADSGSQQSLQILERCAAELEQAYVSGRLPDPQLDAYFVHDRCMRESGHDTTFRWMSADTDRCADHVTIDLNALLFRYEIDIAQTYAELGESSSTAAWCERARARQRLIQRYLWDDELGLFFDYDFVRQKRSSYLSATTLYPLWASRDNTCGVQLVNAEQARRLVHGSVERLEAPGGLMATDPSSLAQVSMPTLIVKRDQGFIRTSVPRQWEAPNGWAPHQMLAWEGLRQHGFENTAQRLAYRWLHMIVSNSAQFHGTVPEKFDVVERSHRVFAEYGNVNAEFSYIAREGFGWVNASVLTGLSLLTPKQQAQLRALESPEVVFVSLP